MKLPETPIPISHEDYFKEAYTGVDAYASGLVHAVCNNGLYLPQKDCGTVYHRACQWLGLPDLPSATREAARNRVFKSLGWKRLKVLVISPTCDAESDDDPRLISLSSRYGKFLASEFERAGLSLSDIMWTALVRYTQPETAGTIKEVHQKACMPYMEADIEHIQPDVILAFGAPVARALFGKKTKIDAVKGVYPKLQLSSGKKVSVVVTQNPKAFLGGYANIEVFRNELSAACQLLSGRAPHEEEANDFTVMRSVADVKAICDRIRSATPSHIGFDTEYGNDLAREEFNYTISIQLSWARNTAAVVVLRDSTGPRFCKEDEASIWKELQDLFSDKRWKIAAHHARADVQQFYRAGYPIDERLEDALDTMLMHWVMYGDELQGLDHLCHKYLPQRYPYWVPLESWLSSQAVSSARLLEYGYAKVPEDVLVPYALRDAETVWVLADMLQQELHKSPVLENLYTSLVAPTSLHLMDVERQGLLINEQARSDLRLFYEPIEKGLLEKLRQELNWPSFNPASKDDVAAALFSKIDYKKKKTPPEGAKVLDLTPLCNTAKYPKPWSDIEDAGEGSLHSPSTKATVLSLIAKQHPDKVVLQLLKHYSVVRKFLTTYLKPQELNEHGVMKDGKGLHNNIHADGRVRTSLSQITSTMRYTSKKPNLQTRPKKQEAAAKDAASFYYHGKSFSDYAKAVEQKLITDESLLGMRSFATCIVPAPGNVFIEADFKTAEVCIWAFCSRDPTLMSMVLDGRDMHLEVACTSFNLPGRVDLPAALEAMQRGDPAPYRAWENKYKKEYSVQRTSAKTVNFGIMYGRGAASLAREIQSAGAQIDRDGAQRIIDDVANMFPLGWAWLQNNMDFAVEHGYVENCFGGRRYFQGVQHMSDKDRAAVRREASNSPIQGAVAGLLSKAGINLYKLLNRTEMGKALKARILLPVHDAFLCEVPAENAVKLYKALQLCMSDMNKIPGTDRSLGIDAEIYPDCWGGKKYDLSKPDEVKAFKQKYLLTA